MANEIFKSALKSRLHEILRDDVEFTKSELCAVIAKVYVSVAKEYKISKINCVVPPARRKPTEYNLFIRDRIAEMSVCEPSIVKFRKAACLWKQRQ